MSGAMRVAAIIRILTESDVDERIVAQVKEELETLVDEIY